MTGWLYRGVAGIELNLENVAPEVKRIDLLADSINTRVKARLYDDFRSAYDMKRNGRFEHFVIGSWERNIADVKNNNIQIIGSNLLAVCTSLSLRITIDKDGKEEQVVCRLQVREKKEDGDVDTDENGGTGGSANAQLRSIRVMPGMGPGLSREVRRHQWIPKIRTRARTRFKSVLSGISTIRYLAIMKN